MTASSTIRYARTHCQAATRHARSIVFLVRGADILVGRFRRSLCGMRRHSATPPKGGVAPPDKAGIALKGHRTEACTWGLSLTREHPAARPAAKTDAPAATQAGSRWRGRAPAATQAGSRWRGRAPAATQAGSRWRGRAPAATQAGSRWRGRASARPATRETRCEGRTGGASAPPEMLVRGERLLQTRKKLLSAPVVLQALGLDQLGIQVGRLRLGRQAADEGVNLGGTEDVNDGPDLRA